MTFGHFVEFLFDVCRKVIIHDVWEILHEEIIDNEANVRRDEFTLVATYVFSQRFLGNLSVG